jgi:hypothetical protein
MMPGSVTQQSPSTLPVARSRFRSAHPWRATGWPTPWQHWLTPSATSSTPAVHRAQDQEVCDVLRCVRFDDLNELTTSVLLPTGS